MGGDPDVEISCFKHVLLCPLLTHGLSQLASDVSPHQTLIMWDSRYVLMSELRQYLTKLKLKLRPHQRHQHLLISNILL